MNSDKQKAMFDMFRTGAEDGISMAMTILGDFYLNGIGVAQDYAKARECYEKAAAQGDANANMALKRLPIHEAATAGRYDEALHLEEVFAANVEAEETKRDGKPGEQTTGELQQATE